MMYLVMLFASASAFASSLPPTPFPIFLKAGFSTVLEFEDTPSRVVLGDTQSFQVEKLEKSLVVKTLTPFATTNMFVYFKAREPKVFLLTASEEAEPTYYRKFTEVVPAKSVAAKSTSSVSRLGKRNVQLVSAKFDGKKDYLTVEIFISADAIGVVRPAWDLVRLTKGSTALSPFKLWSERKEVQKDSRIKARFIFAKPNISRDLKLFSLVVPLIGEVTPLKVSL